MNLEAIVSQDDFSKVIGVSPPVVSGLVKRNVILPDQTLGAWILAYCAHQREQAAGRSLELSTERAGLAKEQKLMARIKKQQALGEWAPIANLSLVLSSVTAQMASMFDGIPRKLKQAYPEITSDQLDLVRAELSAARNLLANAGLDAAKGEAVRAADYVLEYDDGAGLDE